MDAEPRGGLADPEGDGGGHWVVCAERVAAPRGPQHTHVAAVGTATQPDGPTRRWTMVELVNAMRLGERFYTGSRSSGRRAAIEPQVCPECGVVTVRSAPGIEADRTVDALEACR